MSNFVRILKVIGRALVRFFCAIGRFFKFMFKRIGRNSKTNKLKKHISKSEKNIEKLYSEIGKNYYEAHADAPEELLSELVGDVTANFTAISEDEASIQTLQEDYLAQKTAAKEKAKARRASDKAKAREEKAILKGEIPASEPVEEHVPVEPDLFAGPSEPFSFDPVPAPAPEPVVAPEPAPVPEPAIVSVPAPEPEPVIVPEPAPEPMTEEEETITSI